MSKNIILVTSKSQLPRAHKLYNRLSFIGKECLILAPDEVEIKDNRYIARNLKYYQEIFKINFFEIRQSAYKLFHSLAEEEIYRGITLRKLTSYKDVALWDLSAQYIFSELVPILYYINIADAILDLEKPQDVYLIDNNATLENIFHLLCKKKLINLFIEIKNRNLTLRINKVFTEYLFFLKKIKRLIVSFYFSYSNLLKCHRLNKTYRIIFFAPTERFFFSMLPVIIKYNNNERLVINTFLSGSNKKMKENKIFYTDFYGYKLYTLSNQNVETFLKKIKDTMYNNAFFNKIFYKEFPIGFLLSSIFEKTIHMDFPEQIREVDIIRKIFTSYKPKVVVVADVSFKITLIAKSLSLSAVVMQSMHTEDIVYFGPTLADVITVGGNFWKEYLSQKNVDPAKIWITGSPRFDFLQNKKFIIKGPDLLNNFAKLKKIVIFATAYSSIMQGTIRYQNIEQTRNVCNAMKNIKEAHLIIKLHPYDNDWGIYKNIAKVASLKDYSIVKNVEMFNLLHNCDLLITYISAVSYEAVLMDKNVISLCYDSNFSSEDWWNFKRYAVTMIVDKPSELENSIRKALFDTKTISLLRKNRREYIYEHAYKLDGNASSRVKKVIDRFCNN